jgi:hypothetical protein
MQYDQTVPCKFSKRRALISREDRNFRDFPTGAIICHLLLPLCRVFHTHRRRPMGDASPLFCFLSRSLIVIDLTRFFHFHSRTHMMISMCIIVYMCAFSGFWKYENKSGVQETCPGSSKVPSRCLHVNTFACRLYCRFIVSFILTRCLMRDVVDSFQFLFASMITRQSACGSLLDSHRRTHMKSQQSHFWFT